MMLKYCSKREHFSYPGMVARTQLAALDNNANTARSQAQIQSGEQAGEARYTSCAFQRQTSVGLSSQSLRKNPTTTCLF